MGPQWRLVYSNYSLKELYYVTEPQSVTPALRPACAGEQPLSCISIYRLYMYVVSSLKLSGYVCTQPHCERLIIIAVSLHKLIEQINP